MLTAVEIGSLARPPDLRHIGVEYPPVRCHRCDSLDTANSISGCWTNALQPLWLAGKTMSHHSEHAAIVETLTRIERETGWATAWRVEDLRDFWGDDDDVDGVDDSMRMDMEVDVNLQTPRSYGGSR